MYRAQKYALLFVVAALVAWSQMSVDSQGNLVVSAVSTGISCPTCAGFLRLGQGTAISTLQPNSSYLAAPSNITTSYVWYMPTAPCTGYVSVDLNGQLSCQAGTGTGGGGGNTSPTSGEVLISSQTLTASVPSIVFTSIPATYRNLILTYHAKGDSTSGTMALNIQFNSDSGTNYSYYSLNSLGNNSGTSQTSIPTGVVEGAGNGPNFAGNGRISILDYASSTFQKSLLSLNGGRFNVTTPYVSMIYGEWTGTSPITSIMILANGGNFVAPSVFTLWGEF